VLLMITLCRSGTRNPPVIATCRADPRHNLKTTFHANSILVLPTPDASGLSEAERPDRSRRRRAQWSLAHRDFATIRSIIRAIRACKRMPRHVVIERDMAEGGHPAKNRTFDLYTSRKATAEPIVVPHLRLDTGKLSLDECVRRCLEYLNCSREPPRHAIPGVTFANRPVGEAPGRRCHTGRSPGTRAPRWQGLTG
jgi:hypothetical protein